MIYISRITVALVFLAFGTALFAQTHTSVGLENEAVYRLIKNAETRGLIDSLPLAKPYPQSFVVDALRKISVKAGHLSEREKRILDGQLSRYAKSTDDVLSLRIETTQHTDLLDIGNVHSINAFGVNVHSDIMETVSVLGLGYLMLDKINANAYAPYTYTVVWDTPHWILYDGVNTGVGTRNTEVVEYLAMGYKVKHEIAASLFDGNLLLRWGRFRRDWSVGEASLQLSGSARPFDGFETNIRLGSIGRISSVVGSLGQYRIDGQEQKMLSTHILELTPFPWVTLSLFESMIWGKRFELVYLSPLSIYHFGQLGTTGDIDNALVGFNISVHVFPYVEFFGSFIEDELKLGRLADLFTYVGNMFAFQAGFRASIPWIPFGEILVQYTKLEPFVYAHYAQEYPFFDSDMSVNINYSHNGENLGYPLPPNSDEMKIGLKFLLPEGLGANLGFRHIRHGDNPNPDAAEEDYVIRGDIDVPLDYANVFEYGEKDFLNDGIYERITELSLNASYDFASIPLAASFGYTFAHANNYKNIEGNRKSWHAVTLSGSFQYSIF
jgi:hypothetical protein